MTLRNSRFAWPNSKYILQMIPALLFSSAANAALFDCASQPGYCLGEGDTVIFRYVGSSSTFGLFGTAEVSGDSIVFTPVDFLAESLDGAGTSSTNDNGTIELIAKPGYSINSLSFAESGEYLMTSTVGSVSVDVDGLVDVMDWNDPVFGPSTQQILGITPAPGTIDGTAHGWQGTAGIDLTGPTWDGIDHLGIVMQNNLAATSYTAGDIAWIKKNSINLTVHTSAVPLPAAAWLFGSGLTGIIGLARLRRQRAQAAGKQNDQR